MKTITLDSRVETAFYEIQQVCSVLRLVNQTFKQNSGGLFNANSDLFLAVENKSEALVSIQNNLQFMIEPESSNKGDMHSHLIAVLRSLDSWCSEFNYSIAEQVPSSSSHITQQDTDIVNALFAADSLVNGTRDSIAKALDVPHIA
ncbi:MAG: hypothetical protein GY897_05795 [Alteromonas sp.]|nr:hypothetical protein [Alteromonas sp.]